MFASVFSQAYIPPGSDCITVHQHNLLSFYICDPGPQNQS